MMLSRSKERHINAVPVKDCLTDSYDAFGRDCTFAGKSNNDNKSDYFHNAAET